MGLLGLVQNYWPHVVGSVVAYFLALAFYRLLLHPLAGLPGPRLAAVTRYYEAYYDVVCNGYYTFKIAQLHEKYGPIIRISPHELHINDPSYFQALYNHDGRWNKYDWAYDAFGAQKSTICSIDHDMHRMRRAPLNSFFSKANVSRRQEILQRLTGKLCDRIRHFSGSDTTINVSLALSAFARDAAAEFILGKTYGNLDADDFNAGVTGVFQSSGSIWRTTKHVRWLDPLMKSLPMSFIENMGDQGTKAFFAFLKDILRITTDAVSASSKSTTKSSEPLSASPPNEKDDVKLGERVMRPLPTNHGDSDAVKETILNDILQSNLPESEKAVARVNDELGTITGAAFETSANTLRLILYYIYTNPRILNRLRAEIGSLKQSVAATKVTDLNLSALEQLPYLTSVLMEGLRFTPGIATRMARVAPDRVLQYKDWQIPSGTPVGMTTLLMHMDATIYPNPKRFDPERWMDAEVRKKSGKTYAPFSRGTRICLGMHLAWAELYMVLAAFVDEFDFDLDNAGPKDIECVSDQFIIGVEDISGIKAWVTEVAA